VLLALKKTRAFDLRIDTRCQGRKDATHLSGKWSSEGADVLALQFENADGPTESLGCRFAACADEAGEDCLTCEGEDFGFTLKVVRR
jgi:hypothetical protein